MDFTDEDVRQFVETLKKLPDTWKNVQDAQESVQCYVQKMYVDLLSIQSSGFQQNENYRNLLHSLMENLVMTLLHEQIFMLVRTEYQDKDEEIYSKCTKLCEMKITADQLGAMDNYSILLPAAVVELASLDLHVTPAEKINCLTTTFDLVLAELKGAIVDVIAKTSDNCIPTLSVSDITPILTTTIIYAKPIHLVSNMIYAEMFYWSKKTKADTESLLAFKKAIDKLSVFTSEMLLPQSTRLCQDIDVMNIIEISRYVEDKFDEGGHRKEPVDPLERHIKHFMNLIAMSTLNETS